MTRISLAAVALAASVALWGCQSRIAHPRATTVQGCISQVDSDYVLTDSQGHKYDLQGNTSGFNGQVGHQFVVRGELVQSSRSPGAPAKITGPEKSQIDVSSAQPAPGSCDSAK